VERTEAREWSVAPASEASRALAHDAGIAEVVARCLVARGIERAEDARRFLRPTLAEGLRSPMQMRDMARAAARLARALAASETIAVYGDYDVDGMSGAATLLVGLREFGADPLLFVPDRLRDGYGLCVAGIDALVDAGARVIITADCGASSHAEIAHAAARGVDVIVCDHHSAPQERPPAYAVLNPIQPGCEFPFKGLCGAAVAFYLLLGLRMVLRESGASSLPDARRYLDLVTLGTIADVVPLRDENRTIVSHGLRRMAETAWPGLRALLQSASVEEASVSSIAYRIAPRINASGRIGDPRQAIELLATSSTERARLLVACLEQNNEERRRIEAEVLAAAREQVARCASPSAAAIVVAGEGWHPGVVGIVAARLGEEHGRPAVVLAIDGDTARGSARAAGGVDVLAALRACGDLFERLGGHRQAAGLTVAAANVEVLRARFVDRVAACAGASVVPSALRCDAEVEAAELTREVLDELLRLEPCGTGNPAPQIAVRRAEVLRARVVGAGHLLLELGTQSSSFSAVGFGLGGLCPTSGATIDVAGVPEIDRFRGRATQRLRLLDLRPC
jgi:single-stranded-DNA-specific exonuclease